ncbi:septin CDC12 [Sugiyamaella lignohabitans]|uniref:Septin CDC12 n=1 Tax=Sugiyamaella lignohabitans TaxID=796027 RepID=A0A167CZ57_9ASCO|nr:septin CDC12 [Sugiyamaella lignohabitans]ANB12283.1 septin CDC12 [Sugiyamaella lignohabitans]
MVVGELGLGKTTFVNTLFGDKFKETPEDHNPIRSTYKMSSDDANRSMSVVHTENGIEVTKSSAIHPMMAPGYKFYEASTKTTRLDIRETSYEEQGFRVHFTVIDTPGFGDFTNNDFAWVPLVKYIDDQHRMYMLREEQPFRKNLVDTRVHACLYFVRPSGHGLLPLDIRVMSELAGRVNLIPVISKADSFTRGELEEFKKNIREAIRANNIDIYEPSMWLDSEVNGLSSDEEDSALKRNAGNWLQNGHASDVLNRFNSHGHNTNGESSDSDELLNGMNSFRDGPSANGEQMEYNGEDSAKTAVHKSDKEIWEESTPFAIISSEEVVSLDNGKPKVRGRVYDWGIAEVENEDHCDFVKLRDVLMSKYMFDLIDTTIERHYNNFRALTMTHRINVANKKHLDTLENSGNQSRKVSPLGGTQALCEIFRYGYTQLQEDSRSQDPIYLARKERLNKHFESIIAFQETKFKKWFRELMAKQQELNEDINRDKRA